LGGFRQDEHVEVSHSAHYQQTKNLLVSYDPKPMGLF
jgi:hypothetical protein